MQPNTPPTQAPLGITFTGSGSEYFRIWIVNLLLTLVTLGIYYPWAKVRRLRYFYGNTQVDGATLDFHGNPLKMLKGSTLVAVLFGVYTAAGQFSNSAGLVALVAVAAIAPALVRASMQFRLANTSWRGLRFRFTGSMADVYRAVLPLYGPAVLLVGLSAFIGPEGENMPTTRWFLLSVLGVLLLTLALQPWTFWKLKQYQHRHYALAAQQTRFNATPGSFYLLCLKILGLVVLPVGLPFVAALAFIANGQLHYYSPVLVIWITFIAIVLVLLLLNVAKPYAITRMQNLVWNHTSSQDLQFRSGLRFRSLLLLTMKNWFFVCITLGLYWPFAAVAVARLRLQAVSIHSSVPLDTLVGQRGTGSNDAAGDAAGDMLSFDLGL